MGARASGERYLVGVPPWRVDRELFDHDECFSTAGSLYMSSVSGAGASVTDIAGEDGHPGILRLALGTTTTGRAAWRIASQVALAGPAAPIEYGVEFTFRVPTLSTVAEEFSLRFGIINSITGDCTDGAYLEYDRVTHGDDRLRLKTAASGVRTTVDSNVALVAGAWERWSVTMVAGLARFRRAGAPIATINSNVPGATRSMTFGIAGVKSAGTTTRTIDLDLIETTMRGLRR